MNKSVTFAALALIGMAPVLHAQSFSGDVALKYGTSNTSDYYVTQILGSVSYQVTPKIGVQLDFSSWGYDDDPISEFTSSTIHGTYAVSPSTVAGVYYGCDQWDPAYCFYGLEAAMTSGKFSGEVAVGRYVDDDGVSTYFNYVTIDAGYAINDSLSVIGKLTSADGPGYSVDVYAIGARYDHASGAYVEGLIGKSIDGSDNDIMSLVAGWEFGGGATFNARDWNSLLITN